MSKDFSEIASKKTKDELIHILVNKEEYKDELVIAIEAELKKRESQNKYINAEKSLVSSDNSNKKIETPFGIYLAGLLLFFTGPIWLFIGFFQAGISTFSGDQSIGLLSIWNIIFAIISIVFGIGILKGAKWGYDWGLGTAFINFCWFGYLFVESEWMLFAFFAIIELLIFISLISNRKYFNLNLNKKVQEPIDLPLELDNQENQQLLKLNNLIQTDKATLFGSSNRSEIKKMLQDLCETPEKSKYILETYNELFDKDLIEDLKNLSDNYDTIKGYCSVFIDNDIVSDKYPHERIG